MAGAFLQKPTTRRISTNRLSTASIKVFVSLSKHDAILRSIKSGNNISLYGFAVLEVNKLRAIELDGKKNLKVLGTPSLRNPLHADIALPAYEDADYDLHIVDQLIEISRFEPLSTFD